MENNLKGLGFFASSIIHLVSIGKHEDVVTIEQCIEQGNVVEYLYKKYERDFSFSFDDSLYNNQQINSYFSQTAGWIEGNEERKFNVAGSHNGLLLLLSIVMQSVIDNDYKWHI